MNLLVARVNRVMLAESSALLAGDLAIDSRAPLTGRYAEQARGLGLATSRQVRLRSVVSAGDKLQLTFDTTGGYYSLRMIIGPTGLMRICNPDADKAVSGYGPCTS